MTLILLRFFLTKRFKLSKSNLFYCFLILFTLLFSTNTTSQVVSDFTTISSNAGCGSLVAEFEDLSTGNPDTWLWDFGNGNTSTLQNPIVVYANPGFYSVQLTASNSLYNDSKSVTDYIKIYENPTAEFIVPGTTSDCVPMLVDFLDISSSSSLISSWTWDFGDGGGSNQQYPSYNYLTEGIYTVSLSVRDNNGCEDLSIFNNLIEAKETPISDFSSNINFSCNTTEEIQFINSSISAISYIWDFGDGQTSTQNNPSHTYNSGVYTVSLITDNGSCTNNLIQNNFIEVGATITPVFTSDVTSGCEDLTVNFTDLTTNGVDSWFWEFGDGTTSNLQHPSHVYSVDGIYNVSLKTSLNSACDNTTVLNNYIEVYANPIIDFEVDNSYTCTLPFSVNFTDNSSNIVSWNWDFGNGDTSILQYPTVNYLNYDNFDVSLSVTNTDGCTSSVFQSDMILTDSVSINFTSSDNIGCLPHEVFFNDNSVSTSPIVSWNWDFGDGNTSTNQNSSNIFQLIGMYSVVLNIETAKGCQISEEYNDFVKVVSPPTTDFIADPLINCAGENIDFTDLTTSPSNITNWTWNFGDGTTSNLQNPTYQYNMIGTYNVTLISGAGDCTDTLVMDNYIEIIEPVAFYIEEYNCSTPLSVNFTNLSLGSSSVLWDFDDGTTSTQFNSSHVFPARGNYNVSLKVTNNVTGCTHEFIKQVKVTIPEANFTYLPTSSGIIDSVICSPKRVNLDNLSRDWANFQVYWEDGYIGYGRLDHLFTDAGIWDVTMVISDTHGCQDTFTINNMYRVNTVTTDFEITNVLGCDSLLVEFSDLSSVSSSVIWDFGDGSSSILNNPQHIYYNEGFYDVTLYSESVDGCFDTLERVEYIQFVYPKANFNVSDISICKNEEVDFSSISDGIALQYQWDFGDGILSNIESPIHQYSDIGMMNVSLTVVDTFGCVNTENINISVQKPVADFSSGGVSSNCPPLITSFNNLSSNNVVTYNWDFGDGLYSSQENPSHLYSNSGQFDVQLIVFDNIACSDTLTQLGLITIFGPTGEFTFEDNLICVSDSVQFMVNVQNTDSYIWSFGDGTFSTDSTPNHTFVSSGVYFPSLVIENSFSCQLIIPFPDSIIVHQVVVDAGSNLEICLDDVIQLNAIGNGTGFVWSPGILLNDSLLNNPFTNISSTTLFTVLSSDTMCSGTDSVLVVVNTEIPIPTFTIDNHCLNDNMEFMGNSGLSTTNLSWTWDIEGSSFLIPNPENTFSNFGVFPITLQIVNLDNNCSSTIQQDIEVYNLPTSNFDATEVCFGEKTLFTDFSSNNVVGWNWNFGDGSGFSNNQNPAYTYYSDGVYIAQLDIVSDMGCENSINSELTVNEIPEMDIFITEVCEGERNVFVSNSTITNGFVSNWNWDFGDFTFLADQENVAHTYSENGIYNVTLTISSDKGCENSETSTATVNDVPLADFTTDNMCVGEMNFFTDFSSVENSSVIEWNWVFGDGIVSNSQNPNHSFYNAGEYQVFLSVVSNKLCSSSVLKDVIIHSLPEVSFLVDNQICENEEVQFVNTSKVIDGNILNYNWDFGDFTTSNLTDPLHIYFYPNLFDVSLEVESEFGCKSDILVEDAINVSANPIADFTFSNHTVSTLNPEIIFTNKSVGENYFQWDFDNGQTNSEDNIINVLFNDTGKYYISLFVENEFNCTDEIIHQIDVVSELSVYIPNAFSPNDDGVNETFVVKGIGIQDFEMQVFDRWGSVIFQSDNLEYGWDGTAFSGQKMNNGTYMYHIYLTDVNGKPWVYNGELNLMK